MLAELHFLRPMWLWMLLPLGAVVWALLRRQGDSDVWRRVVDAHLLARLLVQPAGGVQRLPLLLLGSGWLLLVLALAGPTWSRLPQPVYQAQEFRVIALDLSPSMNANDLSPTRLTHARFEVLDLLRLAQEGHTALLAYGAEPYIVSPLTTDVATIEAQVASLQTGLLPVQGARRTDLVIDEASQLLAQAGAQDGQIILLTDSLEHPGAANEAARRAAAQGYRVSVLGVGTTEGGPVPLGDGGFLKDRSGAIVVTRLQVGALQTLADAGGGRYVQAAAGSRDVEALLPSLRGAAPGQEGQDSDAESDQWLEQGPWLLLLLLPVAALAFRRGWFSPLLLVLVVLPRADAYAVTWQDLWLRADQQALRSLEAGEAARAAELFTQPDWQAAADYQAGNYARALATLEQQTGAEAAYNRGNALARSGRLEDAVAAYDDALEAEPGNEDARHNRDLVQRLLAQRRAQQQQRQPQSQDQQQADAQDQAGGDDQQEQQGATGDGDGQQQQDAAQAAQGGEQRQDQASGGPGQQAGSEQRQDSEASAGGDGQREQSAASGPAANQDQSGAAQAEAAGQGASEPGEPRQADSQTDPAAEQAGAGGQQDTPAGQQQAQSARDDPAREQGDGLAQGEQPDASAATDDAQRAAQAATADDGSSQEAFGGQDGQHSAGSQDAAPPQAAAAGGADDGALRAGGEPGLGDLMGGDAGSHSRTPTPGGERIGGVDAESRQAMEQMLRRVEDDPAGLLRQRFLLQHLRRNGRL